MELLALIFALLLAIAVWGVLSDVRLRKSPDRKGEQLPRCGQCGYIVHRLPSHRCPECGADLNVVGIRWGDE